MFSVFQSEDARISSATYDCRGELENPENIGGLSIDPSIVILSMTNGATKTYYCAVSTVI